METAKAKASSEMTSFRAKLRIAKEAAGEAAISSLASTSKSIETKRKVPRKKA